MNKSVLACAFYPQCLYNMAAGTASSVRQLARALTVWDRIPEGGATFSVHVQTGPESHSAPCTMGTGTFSGVKRPRRDADHPPPSGFHENWLISLPNKQISTSFKICSLGIKLHNFQAPNNGINWSWKELTLILLTWRIGWAHNNARK